MTKEQIIRFVLIDLEGGDKVITDTGGVTKYGIAQKFNPDVDVCNLDEAGAIQIYDKRYWTKNGLDEYLFPINLIIYDAFVNGGGSDLKELYDTNRYHWAILMLARSHRYLRLCKGKTKYDIYFEGWESRLDKITMKIMEVMYQSSL
jgi:lysozyme family protein